MLRLLLIAENSRDDGSNGCKSVRKLNAECVRHHATIGPASNINPFWVNGIVLDEFIKKRINEANIIHPVAHRWPAAVACVPGEDSEQASFSACPFRVDHDEAFFSGFLGKPGPFLGIVAIAATAMQHKNKRHFSGAVHRYCRSSNNKASFDPIMHESLALPGDGAAFSRINLNTIEACQHPDKRYYEDPHFH